MPSAESGSATLTDDQSLQQTDTFYDYQDYEEEVNYTTTTATTTTSTEPSTTSTTDAPTTTPSLQKLEYVMTICLLLKNDFNIFFYGCFSRYVDQSPNELSSTVSPTTIQLDKHISYSSTESYASNPSSTSSRPPLEDRSPTEVAEDEDVLRLLGQIEADVPRIQKPYSAKSSSSSLLANRNSVFLPRIRRDTIVEMMAKPRRNRTRSGTGRRVTTTTQPTVVVSTVLTASPAPADDNGPFTCVGRIIGGFYADISSGCRRFYTCSLGKKNR